MTKAKGGKNLYLHMAIACFIGIIAIFVIDGYLGIYDTIYMKTGERETTIETEYWLDSYPRPSKAYYMGIDWGEEAFFRYEIANRRFSSYETPIKVSLWKGNEKIIDLFSEDKSIKPFDEMVVEWTLDSEELQARGFGVGEFTMKIERNGMVREMILSYHSLSPEAPNPVYSPVPRY